MEFKPTNFIKESIVDSVEAGVATYKEYCALVDNFTMITESIALNKAMVDENPDSSDYENLMSSLYAKRAMVVSEIQSFFTSGGVITGIHSLGKTKNGYKMAVSWVNDFDTCPSHIAKDLRRVPPPNSDYFKYEE